VYRQSPSTTDALYFADHRTFPSRIFCHIMRSTYGKITYAYCPYVIGKKITCVPSQLAYHLIPASDAAPRHLRLRPSNLNRLTVPHCRLSTYGCRAFYHAGLTVWNSLPDELRDYDSFDGCKRFSKTILFSRY